MSEDTVTIVVPDPHFTLVNATREGSPEVIVINDALLSFVHINIFPWHLRIRIEATEMAKNGMPTSEESQLLFEIGDEIEASVLNGRTAFGGENALFLARSTWSELRELYFCVHDPEIADVALKQLLDAGTHERSWEYRMSHDPEWNEAGYIFRLFPLARGHDA